MPTPASLSTAALGSPVPTYTASPEGSRGSIRIEPIAFESSEPVMNCQCMLAPPSSALSDVQTPPPAAPTYRRQLFSEQLLLIAMAVMRPEAT